MNDESEKALYRFEYYEPEDKETYVDWVWLSDSEINDYKSSYGTFKMRPATEEETDLYNEAYADGYGVAAVLEFESQYDGISFRVELGEDGLLDVKGTKMFECAICGNHKDFETEVATVGDFYLGMVKDDKLWHLCFDCVMIQQEIDSIEFDPEAES